MTRLFILFQYLLPHHLLSRGVGVLAQNHLLRKLFIRAFIKRYKVDLSQAKIQEVDKFENFNAFFTRELQSNARPLANVQGAIVVPADGEFSQLGTITNGNLLQAKGSSYRCKSYLPVTNRWRSFIGRQILPRSISHQEIIIASICQWTGILRKTVYVPGKLFSVNQVTADSVPNLFARNERSICLFDT